MSCCIPCLPPTYLACCIDLAYLLKPSKGGAGWETQETVEKCR
ncbi:hypothetical protein P186_1506 [Pyrobaculum ferrireducens]|uniref:Uncharacterized protein n=1 Tax=Pyrobaculum ferrireducens TaxID=1104324 RepID=G7VFB9_9CREN|nr:hypothetical protein P186_1506 [Pyrobaculum ferrireducens]